MRAASRKAALLTGTLALFLSLYAGSHATWIVVKANVAQHLLDVSWAHSLASGGARKPWFWADVQTIARMHIAAIGKSFIVLSDASGEAMAFGPGLVGGDPGQALSSTLAIGGHRDTHLSFLEQLPLGTIIELQTVAHQGLRYQLIDKQIVDSRQQTLTISQQSPGLVLITCYPFSAGQTGGPLRMVARAVRVDSSTSTTGFL